MLVRVVLAATFLALCGLGTAMLAGRMLPSPGDEIWFEIRNDSSSAASVSLSNRQDPILVEPGTIMSAVALRVEPGQPVTYTLSVVVTSEGRELLRQQIGPDELMASPEIVVRDTAAVLRTGKGSP